MKQKSTKNLIAILKEIAERNDSVVAVVHGVADSGPLYEADLPSNLKILCIGDYMECGIFTHRILSEEFIQERCKLYRNLCEEYSETARDYREYTVKPLLYLKNHKTDKIVLAQIDCDTSDIWYLTMLAYLEQEKTAEEVIRVKFDAERDTAYYYGVNTVNGALSAYQSFICDRKMTNLEQFGISQKSIECFLDFYNYAGSMADFLKSVRLKCWPISYAYFLREHGNVGLSESAFLWIAKYLWEDDSDGQKILARWDRNRKYIDLWGTEKMTMKDLYTELYDRMDGERFTIEKRNYTINTLSHFVAQKGKEYDSANFKLMIVGRATNGWENFFEHGTEPDAIAFGEIAQRKFDEPGFGWVQEKDGYLWDGKEYYLNKSSFWRTTHQIWREMNENKLNPVKWVDYIAWSNLYKIAPAIVKEKLEDGTEISISGNPTTKLCDYQQTMCREILEHEIEAFQPDGVLFITGHWWWSQGGNDGFSRINQIEELSEVRENHRGNGIFVEQTAKFKSSKGKTIPVVVACRPETRPERDYVKQVVDTFHNLIK